MSRKTRELTHNVLADWLGDQIERIRPYAKHIGIVIGVLLLGFIVTMFVISRQQAAVAAQWTDWMIAVNATSVTGDVRPLLEVAEEHPNTDAGLWALQFAGDLEVQFALSQYARDREASRRGIEEARDRFQHVTDNTRRGNQYLRRVAMYSLAHAEESLGNMSAARAVYQQLVELAPDSPFAPAAERGLQRTSDPRYAEIFEQFIVYEPPVTDPGTEVPPRPDISFPDLDEPAEEPGEAFDAPAEHQPLPPEDQPPPDEPSVAPPDLQSDFS